MKKTLVSLLALSVVSPVFASDADLVGNDFPKVKVSADLNVGVMAGENNGRATVRESLVKAELQLAERVKLVVQAKLEEAFQSQTRNTTNDSLAWTNDFDLDTFIRDAYIRIDNIFGTPVAIIIGKHQVAFGQQVKEMPIFAQNPMFSIQEKDEVLGFTLVLDQAVLGGLFDSVELSFFESKGGDFQVSDFDGASIRITKELIAGLSAQVSYATMGNGTLPREERLSLGLVYQSFDGKLKFWTEAIFMNDTLQYGKANHAVTGGVSYRVTEKGLVIAEITHVEDFITQYGVAYKHEVNGNLSVGPEVRYNDYKNGNGRDEWVFGVGANLKLGAGSEDQDVTDLDTLKE